MKTLHYTAIEAKDAEGGSSKLTIRWLITKETGAKNFAMRLFEMEAGGHAPSTTTAGNTKSSYWKAKELWLAETKKRSSKPETPFFFLQTRNIN